MVEEDAQSSPKLQEIVQKSVDKLAALLGAIHSGVPLEMPTDLIATINKIMEEIILTPVLLSALTSAPTLAPTSAPEPKDTTRVPDALIDKLTDLVRELSISHAQLEQQQGAVKNNLSEMEQAVTRLCDCDQLRRLEIETEAQILSHYTQILSLLKDTMGIKIDEEFAPPKTRPLFGNETIVSSFARKYYQ